MRREGDRLLLQLRTASKTVLLCAPFIKQNVLRSLLAAIRSDVEVRIVTRWLPDEVRAGVSDLEVFDIVEARPKTRLELLDNLHAKVFLSDEQALIGSANLTAAALGWRKPSNIELLVDVSLDGAALAACLLALDDARPATADEREQVSKAAAALPAAVVQEVDDLPDDVTQMPWLPSLSAPDRLFEAYEPGRRLKMDASVLTAADLDLEALNLPFGLTADTFKQAVAGAIITMPAMSLLLHKIEHDDLNDAEAVEIISSFIVGSTIPVQRRWEIVRDWLTVFLGDRFESVPDTFITRRRPGIR